MATLGCLEGIKRAYSKNSAGWVEGPIANPKSRKQVLLEDGKVVCIVVGEEDFVITKNDVESFECVSQNVPRASGNSTVLCNVYGVKLNDGKYGTFHIYVAKAAEFTMLLK